jgi:DNA-binding protein H-NS
MESVKQVRESILADIMRQMEIYDLDVADLGELPASRPAFAPVKYSNAYGRSWDGTGSPPEWLQRALNAGQTLEHFRAFPLS